MAETTRDLGWVPTSMTPEEAERLVEMNGMTYLWQPPGPVSPEEYLRREAISLEKSEYYGGRPHPLHGSPNEQGCMPGASRNHIFVTANVQDALRTSLRGTECVAIGGDMRIAAKTDGKFYYPDVVVICGEEQYVEGQPQATLRNPTLLVEVLSPSTEQKDRGEKFEAYRTLDSLQAYVLVAQDRRHVEVFAKNETGHWVLREFGADSEHVALPSVGAQLEMDALYENVESVK